MKKSYSQNFIFVTGKGKHSICGTKFHTGRSRNGKVHLTAIQLKFLEACIGVFWGRNVVEKYKTWNKVTTNEVTKIRSEILFFSSIMRKRFFSIRLLQIKLSIFFRKQCFSCTLLIVGITIIINSTSFIANFSMTLECWHTLGHFTCFIHFNYTKYNSGLK